MNKNTVLQYETVIDFKEVLWRLLSQWKAVFLVSLLMAVLFCGLKYYNDTLAYNAYIESQKEASQKAAMSVNERIEEIVSTLPKDERAAVNYVVGQKELVNNSINYIGRSILFNTNSSNQRTLYLLYDVDADNPEDLPIIMSSYQSYIYGDVFAEALKNVIEPKTENVYISELIQSELFNQADLDNENGRGAFIFSVVLPEEADAENVSATATASLKKYSSELTANYPGSIERVDSLESHIFDKNNVDKKADTLIVVDSMKNNIKNVENTLSKEQKAAIEAIMIIKSEAAATEEENEETGGTRNSTIAEHDEIAMPRWSKIGILIGLVFGVFVYVGIYFLHLLLNGYIESANSLEEYTCSRMLGEVYFEKEKTSIKEKILRSKWIDKLHYRNKIDNVKQINRVSSSIEAICAHDGIENLTLINVINDSWLEDRFINMIKEACKNRGVSISILDANEDVDEIKIGEAKRVLIAANDRTKSKYLCTIVGLCTSYDTEIKGSIFTSSI